MSDRGAASFFATGSPAARTEINSVMLIGVLLAINIIVCLALIGVVLLQRSEGGALGMGGGGAGGGFMTARGAGDLLTRTTWILFSIFLTISLVLTILTGRMGGDKSVVDRLKLKGLDASALSAPVVAPVPAGQTPATATPGEVQAPTPRLGAPVVPAAPIPTPAQTPAQ